MRRLNFFRNYLAERYGRELSRIGFDLALGCPNRSGGFGEGCAFCAADAARARHLGRDLDLAAQARLGIDYVRRRYGAEAPYIAYFQSFTNTFAPVERLRALYREALSQADFRMVIVSTRPDALPDGVVDFLKELQRDYEVWVELGVQSAHDVTLARLNRGHGFQAAADAAKRLAAVGIKTAAHLILGLPGEGEAEWGETARQVAQLPFSAVKIHPLLVLKDAPLARQYRARPFPTLNEYEYARALKTVLRLLPEELLIMRLTAEASPEELIAPRWWMAKGQFLDFFRRIWEGAGDECFPGVVTADGSRTLYHPEFRQHFHSLAGAAGEARHKFILPSRLEERLAAGPVRLLDVGFGLGGNSFAALDAVRSHPLSVVALENDPRVVKAACEIASGRDRERLSRLLEEGRLSEECASLELHFGDARSLVRALPDDAFDLIYLDAFSPDVNPELWSLHFLRQLRRVLAPGGALLTYSSAAPVRGALLKLGFTVGETPAFGRRRGGTVAGGGDIAPLDDREIRIITRSTAGVPYADPTLAAPRRAILEHREKVVRRLRARGIPKWYRE